MYILIHVCQVLYISQSRKKNLRPLEICIKTSRFLIAPPPPPTPPLSEKQRYSDIWSKIRPVLSRPLRRPNKRSIASILFLVVIVPRHGLVWVTCCQIHGLLQRATRLVFVLSGPPPAHASSPVLSNPLVAAALPNSAHLLAGWALLDGWVKLYPSQDKVRLFTS